MTTINKLPESTYLVRFPDCDPFNHLNNSKYIDYFINAREDHLRDFYQFEIYQFTQQTGTSWVVGQNQIAYFAPATLMENVVIQTTVLEWNNSDILVEMRMWDNNKTHLKALLWTRFVHIDMKTLKRIPHTPELTERFKVLLNALEQPQTFDQRAMAVRRKKYEEL